MGLCAGHGHHGTMNNMGFSEQLNHIWRTRPIRLPKSSPGAGVAAGFAYRYNVDATLVRVAFVVATIFGGAGIVLYLAAWLLFNPPGDRVPAIESLFGKGHSSQSQSKTVVILIALIIAVSSMGPLNIGIHGSGLFSLALMLGGWWMLYLRTPNPPAPPAGSEWGWGLGTHAPVSSGTPTWTEYGPSYQPPTPTATEVTDAVPPQFAASGQNLTDAPPSTSAVSDDARQTIRNQTAAQQNLTDTVTTTTAKPPSWDPLGVAPFAWDLPEPKGAADPIPARSKQSRHTSVFLGIAILTAAAGSVGHVLGIGWLTPARIAALALAVIGVGLVHGAFRRRGFGLLLIAAPLAGFVVLASMIGPIHIDRNLMGQQTWAPRAVDDLRSDYKVNLGQGTLDLRGLTMTQARTVHLDAAFGQIEVLVPAGMNVRTHCVAAIAGQCPPEGLNVERRREPGVKRMMGDSDTTHSNTATSGPELTLDIDVRGGQVEVRRD